MRYQAALRPDCIFAIVPDREYHEAGILPALFNKKDSNRGARLALQDLQYFFKFQSHLTHDLVGNAHLHPSLMALQTRARAGNGEALVVEQRADLADHQHIVALVIAAVAAALDRLEVGKFLLPIAQHVRLDAAQLADFANGEIAFRRDGGEFGVIPLIQHSLRLLP